MKQSTVAKLPGMYLRGTVWQLRVMIPLKLQPAYGGRTKLIRSLETSDWREASRKGAALRAQLLQEFEEKSRSLNPEPVAQVKPELGQTIGARILAIAEAASPDTVVNHALAMVWLWKEEPRAFASDDAFRAQMARRIRLLAPRLSKGTYWNAKLQRVSTVVQELPPKVAVGLGQQLIDLFGPAGIRLAQLERERVPPEEAARRRLREALSELQ